MSKIYVREDTSVWKIQTWLSFGIAFFLSVIGVWNMPSTSLDRVLAAVSLLFVLSSSFVLSKTMRDNQYKQVDTQSWIAQVWISFILSISFTVWGIYRMNIGEWHKMFVIGSAIFLLSSAFTLAKAIRDANEAKTVNQTQSNDPDDAS